MSLSEITSRTEELSIVPYGCGGWISFPHCDQLIHERVTLFRNILDIVPSFTTMSNVETFMFVLTSHDLDIWKVVILNVSNMYQVNQSMKQN